MAWGNLLWSCLAALITAVEAQTAGGNCSWHWPNWPLVDVNLFDLAVPTPYTCSFSIVIDEECGTDTVIWSPTATVNGTLYSLTTPSTQLFTPETDFVALTFEDLIVTSLVPGEVIFIEWFAKAGGEVAVPTDAITYIPGEASSASTLTLPPETATTAATNQPSTTAASSSSASHTGGIVAGAVVGGLIILGLAFFIGWKFRRSRQGQTRDSVYNTDPYTSPDTWELDRVTGAAIPKHKPALTK